ncbi:MAG: [FeFe] hydrogenase H-cluster radical SAM maturase HydE [Lachnospiraceae bacterium]|jgi:biotin synthase|nr:[FeFe] hydrogenase H-cluster radical SAM maturase HydE [Lachnospiraceae bacterium]
MADVVERFVRDHGLADEEEYGILLRRLEKPETAEYLRTEAVRLQRMYYGNKVYVRGLLEYTNYCRNNCYYCGIQRENRKVMRYRLTLEEILACCEEGWKLGFRTFVLQGGEDPFDTEERVVKLIHSIKAAWPDCALTLSIGERSYECYQAFRRAGADRYLLRHETADETHYRSLHPADRSLGARKQCLFELKRLGFQTGTGFLVGSPGQTYRELAKDLAFLKELQPEMVGIGPFIPHRDTRFAGEQAGSVELTLKLLSVIRILLPRVLLPATTALGTLAADGRERGFMAGANVVMPNLSPKKNRKQYSLYDNKLCEGAEAAEGLKALDARMRAVGYELCMDRGDAAREAEIGS